MSKPFTLIDIWKHSTLGAKVLIILSPIIIPIVVPLAIVLVTLEELRYWKRRRRVRKSHER